MNASRDDKGWPAGRRIREGASEYVGFIDDDDDDEEEEEADDDNDKAV